MRRSSWLALIVLAAVSAVASSGWHVVRPGEQIVVRRLGGRDPASVGPDARVVADSPSFPPFSYAGTARADPGVTFSAAHPRGSLPHPSRQS